MKIGIEAVGYILPYGLEKGFVKMKEHGYDAADFSLCDTDGVFYQGSEGEIESRLLEVKAAAEAAGIFFSQTHGPWRFPPRDFTPVDRAERFEKMSRALHYTAVLGCRNMAIHPVMPFGDDNPYPVQFWDMNYDFYSRLVKVAEKENVVIGYENMPFRTHTIAAVESTLAMVKKIDSPWMKVCLDTGHARVLNESPADAVRLLGKEYLAITHVHDNKIRMDLHLAPYEGDIDWLDFRRALTEIGYDGVLSLETAVNPAQLSPELLERKQIALAETAKELATPLY